MSDLHITLVSDLHVEFGRLNRPLPEGDILLLAGDTTVVAYLQAHRTDAQSRKVRKATEHLNAEIAKKFRRAYAVVGNHEAYGSYYGDVAIALTDALPAVRVLNCEHVTLSDDVILFGAPLWTDMDRGNPTTMAAIQFGMSDFRYIQASDGLFTPAMAAEEFHRTVAYLGKLAEEQRDKTIIVMTHHCPTRKCLNPRDGGNLLDYAYASDLDDFIADHPNITLWCCGHTHVRATLEIAQCTVAMNARGYYQNDQIWRSFDPAACQFTIQDGVIHRPKIAAE